MNLVKAEDWLGSTTYGQLAFLSVLDLDIQSVQLEFLAYDRLATRRPLSDGEISEAIHHAKTYACAVHRVAQFLALIQRSKRFAPAANRLKRHLKVNKAAFQQFRNVRNVIEHSQKELPEFPSVAPLSIHRSRAILPIGVLIPVERLMVDTLVGIRADLIADLRTSFRSPQETDDHGLDGSKATTLCLGCGKRYKLPFELRFGHDDEELGQVWLATPCSSCGKVPSTFGAAGLGPPR